MPMTDEEFKELNDNLFEAFCRGEAAELRPFFRNPPPCTATGLIKYYFEALENGDTLSATRVAKYLRLTPQKGETK